MKAIQAAAAVRLMVSHRDFRNANRYLLWFSDDLSLAGDDYDYISAMTEDDPGFTGYEQFDAALAAFSEIHRDLVGLPNLEWILDVERYIELSALHPGEIVDEDLASYYGLVHPTLLEHGVVIRGASLAIWNADSESQRAG